MVSYKNRFIWSQAQSLYVDDIGFVDKMYTPHVCLLHKSLYGLKNRLVNGMIALHLIC